MATSRLSIPDHKGSQRLTQLRNTFSSPAPPEHLKSSATEAADKDPPNVKEHFKGHHHGSVRSVLIILFDIILVLCSLMFFALGVAAVCLNGKLVALHPFGNLLIQATKAVHSHIPKAD